MAYNSATKTVTIDTATESFNEILDNVATALGDFRITNDPGQAARDVGLLCSSPKVSKWARFKSESYPVLSGLTEAQRASNRFGFAATPTIPFTSDGIGHGEYSIILPQGTESSPYRLLDFNGYRHNAAAPINHWFIGASGNEDSFHREDGLGVTVNFNTGITNWSSNDCVTMLEAIESQYRDYYIGLLISKGLTRWLIPSTTKVKEYSNPFAIILVPNSDGVNADSVANGATIWSEMASEANEGSEYTFAVVATNLSRKEDGTAYESGTFPPPRSLELAYGKDRHKAIMTTKAAIAGITGYFNTDWLSYTVQTTSDVSGMGLIKPNGSQKLTVNITTPASWNRSSVHLKVEMRNLSGMIYQNGTALNTGSVILTKDVSISAGQSTSVDILSYWTYPNQYWFSYPTPAGYGKVQFILKAYRNSTSTKEEIELSSITVDFPA